MKTPLGTEVDIGAGHIVLDGFPALRERGTAPPLLAPPYPLQDFKALYKCCICCIIIIIMSIVATVAHLSYC